MNWQKKFTIRLSSEENPPKIGMRVEVLKPIDSNNALIGLKGTIFSCDHNIKVSYDQDFDGAYEHREQEFTWNASKSEWNRGHFKILEE